MTGDPGPLLRLLERSVADGITPGAVALIGTGEGALVRSAHGRAQVVPEPADLDADTPFDLASLTKPLATAALALSPELSLPPETRARALLPELDTLDLSDITLHHLLTHSSGLPAWRPLFLRAGSPSGYLKELRAAPLVGRAGDRVVYSDPGYIAAGEMVARAAGAGLDELFRDLLAAPLGLSACFRPPPGMAARAAATEVGQRCEREMAGEEGERYGGWREGTIRGQVHDQHAWAAGGVLGSAGLFGTASDVYRLALECLGAGRGLLPAGARERMRRRADVPEGEARSEGFALNVAGEGSGGPALPASAFGHTGFTGTSVWVDPERRRVYVLLTNRIHPEVRDVDMLGLRHAFHRLAAEV